MNGRSVLYRISHSSKAGLQRNGLPFYRTNGNQEDEKLGVAMRVGPARLGPARTTRAGPPSPAYFMRAENIGPPRILLSPGPLADPLFFLFL